MHQNNGSVHGVCVGWPLVFLLTQCSKMQVNFRKIRGSSRQQASCMPPGAIAVTPPHTVPSEFPCSQTAAAAENKCQQCSRPEVRL